MKYQSALYSILGSITLLSMTYGDSAFAFSNGRYVGIREELNVLRMSLQSCEGINFNFFNTKGEFDCQAAKAALKEAERRIGLAEGNLKKANELMQQTSLADWIQKRDQINNELTQATSNLQAAEAVLQKLQAELDKDPNNKDLLAAVSDQTKRVTELRHSVERLGRSYVDACGLIGQDGTGKALEQIKNDLSQIISGQSEVIQCLKGKLDTILKALETFCPDEMITFDELLIETQTNLGKLKCDPIHQRDIYGTSKYSFTGKSPEEVAEKAKAALVDWYKNVNVPAPYEREFCSPNLTVFWYDIGKDGSPFYRELYEFSGAHFGGFSVSKVGPFEWILSNPHLSSIFDPRDYTKQNWNPSKTYGGRFLIRCFSCPDSKKDGPPPPPPAPPAPPQR